MEVKLAKTGSTQEREGDAFFVFPGDYSLNSKVKIALLKSSIWVKKTCANDLEMQMDVVAVGNVSQF